mmetsp:Transcript_14332/g.54014  ORF Transcript_14332/g.54014 Transcript_14332/m.54014 type:complete len:244 (-) Transcript_14332:187-918(-)
METLRTESGVSRNSENHRFVRSPFCFSLHVHSHSSFLDKICQKRHPSYSSLLLSYSLKRVYFSQDTLGSGCQNGAFDVSFESPRVSGGPTQLVSFPSNDALQRARPPILSRLAFGAAARLVRGFCSGFRGGVGGRFQESHNGLLRSAGRRADEHRVSGPGHDVVLVEVPRGVSGVRGVLKERVHRRFRLSHHIDLGHHGESDASGGHELLDLLRSAWLLSAELVAGEQQELQAGVVVGVVKSH